MSADLCFTTDSFFFYLLFCPLISELAERNSTISSHMVGSKCDLKMHVQNPGYSFALQIRGPKSQSHLFSTTLQLNGNFNGLYPQSETRHKQAVSAMTKCHELWSTNGFKLDPNLYPLYLYSAFYFIVRLRRRTSAK